MGLEDRINEIRKRGDYVNAEELCDLESHLEELKEERGEVRKHSKLYYFVDRVLQKERRVLVKKKTYITLLLTCGWFSGSHRFYRKRNTTGILYLIFFWTGIPFAMSLIDLMEVLPIEEDEKGMIYF